MNKQEEGYEYLKHITEETFIKIHNEAIKIGGAWDSGIREPGSLFHITEILKEMVREKEDIVVIVARLMAFIIKEHPFWDGNHRTAFETAQLILRAFGHEMRIDREEAERFIRSIDKPTIKEETIIEWIKKNMQPIQD